MTVDGKIGVREGRVALQQIGTMHDEEQTLHYEIVRGPRNGQLVGLVGRLHLIVEQDDTHRYELDYSFGTTTRIT